GVILKNGNCLTSLMGFMLLSWSFAGIAQLVERNLAKVEVAGSSPVSRSRFKKAQTSVWAFLRSGGCCQAITCSLKIGGSASPGCHPPPFRQQLAHLRPIVTVIHEVHHAPIILGADHAAGGLDH